MYQFSHTFFKKVISCDHSDYFIIIWPFKALCLGKFQKANESLEISIKDSFKFSYSQHGRSLQTLVEFLLKVERRVLIEDYYSECGSLRITLETQPPLKLYSSLKFEKKNDEEGFDDFLIIKRRNSELKILIKNIYDRFLHGIWNNVLTHDVVKEFIIKFRDIKNTRDIGQFYTLSPHERLSIVDKTLQPFRTLTNQEHFVNLRNIHYYEIEFSTNLNDIITFSNLSDYIKEYWRPKKRPYLYPWQCPPPSADRPPLDKASATSVDPPPPDKGLGSTDAGPSGLASTEAGPSHSASAPITTVNQLLNVTKNLPNDWLDGEAEV